MIKKIIYILLFSFLVAGTDGTIRGKVIAANDGQPLAGVQVFIASEQKGAVSDIDGNFLILKVPIDDHELTVNLLGYKTGYCNCFSSKKVDEILGTKKSKLIVGIGHSDDNRNRQEHHLNPDYIYPSFDKNIEIKII